MKRGEREAGPEKRRHKRIGNTDRLALILVLLLAAGLAGGFVLAVLSIRHQYTGALVCWTAAFGPIGTAVSVVLCRIVDKTRAENTGPNGEGVKYASAQAKRFVEKNSYSVESPPI